MNVRIKTEPEEYNRIKEIAKEDKTFQPYLRWFEGRENKLSDHERRCQVRLESIRNKNKGMTHQNLADIAGCSRGVVSNILNGTNQCSKEMADRIMLNLDKKGYCTD